ncbi:asparagine synthetase B family protein [Prochlorococcus marinus]|uniref:asparagine synthetase B family protein n=1 Tax=Prochlorococcus marinus TaxID=1219 RepID=UPI001ADB4FC6|nr:asparagine synthetase B [Prochlorococcus marinus]MBO8204951.1 asparagine synthetase B [Prochlorococcus marinus CUG1415]MBW3044223.1 hypothetical protein [Prochlorococcus marinus str. MU1415]
MCGFLTAISTKEIDENKFNEISLLSKHIEHRGPDDFFYYRDSIFVSFFYRLAIRDFSTKSRQPIESKNCRYILCFNGEIYNTEKEFKNSDTLYVLKILEKKGINGLNELRGMFSICIYDKKTKLIHLIRDHLGIKPLFFVSSEKTIGSKYENFFFICSEQKPLINLPFKKSIDEYQAIRYLKMGVSFDQKDTFFEHIKQIEPGTIFTINLENLNYSSVKLNKNLINLDLKSNFKFKSKHHSKFLKNIIKEHIISDSPVCSTISGGIDSTYVSTAIANVQEQECDAFTIKSNIFESEIKNDSDLYRVKNLKINTINCELENLSKNINNMVDNLSSPFASASWIFQDQLFNKISRKYNYKVLLVGEGADEIYSGYKRLVYPYLFCLEIENKLNEFEEIKSKFSEFLNLPIENINKNYLLFKNNLLKETDYEDQNYEYFFKSKLRVPMERYYPGIKSKECMKNINPETFYKSHLLNYIKRSDVPSSLYILDIISMKYGIELRVPFLDISLLEKVLEFSYKEHFKNGYNKNILREVSYLTPKSILENKVKKQRPCSTSKIMYDHLAKEFEELLNSENPLLENKKILDSFLLSKAKREEESSSIWFRIYTYLVFYNKFFSK